MKCIMVMVRIVSLFWTDLTGFLQDTQNAVASIFEGFHIGIDTTQRFLASVPAPPRPFNGTSWPGCKVGFTIESPVWGLSGPTKLGLLP
jgi:hypothetical protein